MGDWILSFLSPNLEASSLLILSFDWEGETTVDRFLRSTLLSPPCNSSMDMVLFVFCKLGDMNGILWGSPIDISSNILLSLCLLGVLGRSLSFFGFRVFEKVDITVRPESSFILLFF